MKVINDDGSFSTNKDDVYKKWMDEFQNLFSKCQNNDFNEESMDDILALKQEFEDSNPREIPNIPNFDAINADLNKNIEVDEILTVISNAKKGKSFGIDMLPNEVFFNANSVLLIHTLFEKCFESGILPDTWSESVIKPIPKNKTNDPRIPLNYRGISLIPTMCKLFSMVLNNRLTKVIESLDMVCDEQNGFRKTRACIDHLYVLTTIIKNRKVRNLLTFAWNYGQLGPKTSRPKTTRPRKKSAQDNSAQVVPISEDNSAQVVPISEDNSAQIVPTFEDLSAHENQTPLNELKMIG